MKVALVFFYCASLLTCSCARTSGALNNNLVLKDKMIHIIWLMFSMFTITFFHFSNSIKDYMNRNSDA